MFLVGTNQTTPGRSVSNHDDKGSHFVWRYHELINCDNSAETPVKKAGMARIAFFVSHPPCLIIIIIIIIIMIIF